MYRYFFGINDFPFGACPDPRFLYKMPHVQEALACLQYGIASRKGFVVLTGEVGTGKTTLLKSVLSSFTERRISTAFVFNPRLDVLDFLEFVLADFGIPPDPRTKSGTPQTKSGMLMQLNRWLIDRFRNGELCAIVVDEAQNLSWELLEEIRLLTNLETSSEKLVQIVLSGQPELEEKLRDPCVRQLRQRVSLWCRTRPLTSEETKAYIARRLHVVGATQPVFSPESVQLIHHYSKGIPRLINLICEHSMISAYVEQIKPIPARIVESVCVELDLDEQPFVLSPLALKGFPENTMQTSTSNTINPVADSTGFPKDREL
ncbi:MAG: AAA family ATPase [Acidobacteriaceae bacterium]|nr:AAA family ATPase [Acidobacteriaceae bacterium]